MHSDQMDRKIVPLLRSPTLAVLGALVLRLILLWLSSDNLGAYWRFRVLGMEESRVAWSVATGKGFSNPFPGYDAPTAWLAPAYPFIWAVLIKLSGLNLTVKTLLAQSLNCLFSAATCWPICSIGKKLFGERIGLASAWLWAALPQAILFPVLWAWDQSLAALTLAVIVDVTLRLRESTAPLAWTGYGLLWALAALVNPALCGLLPFLLGWLIYRRRRLGWATFGSYARVVAVFVLAVLPWTIRNYYSVGGWVFVKSNFGVELWLGNHDPSITRDRHPMNSLPDRFQLIFAGEARFDQSRRRMAMAFIQTHPGVFLNSSWDRFRGTWMPANDHDLNGWNEAPHLGPVALWYCAAFTVLSLAGLIFALRDQWTDSLPLATTLIVFPLPYYITHTDLRYRHPIDALMAILAVYAVARLWSAVSVRPARARARQIESV
jgi:4-amino-4-deoxy-L-arabinose transferase-like glycosyltransferase